MTKKTLILLFLINLLGILLRFRDITTNPPNLNTDEAAIGYNAYSILKTGKDEYGQSFPLAFRSFDDYKPPLYIYLTVPSVAVFGLNEFAVRFPSAFLGVLAIIITFLLTKKLFSNPVTGLLAAFLLAISPWHIQFTRTAYETGSNAFFTSLGLLLFLKGLEKKWYWIPAGIVFGLQMYLYQASKVFVPMLVASLIIIFLHRANWRNLLAFLIPFVFFLVPLGLQTVSATGMLRIQGTSIFQDPKAIIHREAYEKTDWLLNDNKSVRLFHSALTTYFQDILVGYLSHFRPDFLLTSRNDPKVSYAPEVGLMQLWVFPFLLIGLYHLFKRKDKIPAAVLILWILISPIPASITTGLPSSIRTAVFLPSLQIVAALGVVSFYKIFRNKLFLVGNVLIAVYLLAFYCHMLFVHAPVMYARAWYLNYKPVVLNSLALAPNYKKVVVSTALDQPQIFYLFYSKYDPKTYLQEGGTMGGGFSQQGNRLANKFFFRPVNWFDLLWKERNALVVAVPSEVPPEAKDHIIAKYNSLDGQPLAYFLDTY